MVGLGINIHQTRVPALSRLLGRRTAAVAPPERPATLPGRQGGVVWGLSVANQASDGHFQGSDVRLRPRAHLLDSNDFGIKAGPNVLSIPPKPRDSYRWHLPASRNMDAKWLTSHPAGQGHQACEHATIRQTLGSMSPSFTTTADLQSTCRLSHIFPSQGSQRTAPTTPARSGSAP